MLWPGDLFPAISTNILLRSCFWIETAQGGRGETGGNIASSLRKFMKMTRLTDSLPKFPLTVNKCQDRGDSSLSYLKTVQALMSYCASFYGLSSTLEWTCLGRIISLVSYWCPIGVNRHELTSLQGRSCNQQPLSFQACLFSG